MRFTLAHELGHVLIPWHVGTRVDDVAAAEGSLPADIATEEAEANRFASELMIPSDWLARQLAEAGDVAAAVGSAADGARMSPLATSLKAASVLPPGYSFALVDAGGQVRASAVSLGTFARPTARDAPLGRHPHPDALACWRHEQAGPDGYASYLWWRLPQERKVPRVRDRRDWRNILEDIFEDVRLPPVEAKRLWASLAAVVASANSRLGPDGTIEALHAIARERLRQRALADPCYAALCSHPKFGDFIVRRIEALKEEAATSSRGRTPQRGRAR